MKECRGLDIVFPFAAEFMDGCIVMPGRPLQTTGHTLYLDLLQNLYVGFGKLYWTEEELQVMNIEVMHWNRIKADTFAEHCSPGLLIFKFHHLHRIAEDHCRFGELSVLDAPLFENYNVHTKTSYRRNS